MSDPDMTFTPQEALSIGMNTPGSDISYGNFLNRTMPNTPAPASAPASKGLTVAEVSAINTGVNGGVAVLGQVFDSLNNSANRDAQAQVRQMQFDLARGAQDLQRAQMEGNQSLQLQLARLQGDRLGNAANLAAGSGDPAAAALLGSLRDQNAELTRRLEEQNATPMWVWGVVAAAGVVTVGAIAYVVATRPSKPSRAGARMSEDDDDDDLERRRQEIRARLRELSAR